MFQLACLVGKGEEKVEITIDEETRAVDGKEGEPQEETSSLPVSVAKGEVEMVFVPAGEFVMGSESFADGIPVHTVYLDGFYIDQYEVTNALYAMCVKASGCSEPINFSPDGKPEHPVRFIRWDDAKTYCEWRGARLPTEAEWEKAARGTDGRTYPWGEGISCDQANYEGCVGDTTEVGSYPSGVSPFGAYDMAGNVLEWVADWWSLDYYAESPVENPQGPSNGNARVARGGSFFDEEVFAQSATRIHLLPAVGGFFMGFRCASSP